MLFDLKPNYGGGSEDNGNLLQNVPCTHCYTQCPRPCSRPLPTQASTRDSWTLTGKSGPVSCGSLLLSPGSRCAQGFVCALQESVSPVLCKFWQLYGGVKVTSSKRVYAIPRSAAPRAPAPAADHCWPVPPQETLKHSKEGLAQSLWGLCILVHTRFCLCPPWWLRAKLQCRRPGFNSWVRKIP